MNSLPLSQNAFSLSEPSMWQVVNKQTSSAIHARQLMEMLLVILELFEYLTPLTTSSFMDGLAFLPQLTFIVSSSPVFILSFLSALFSVSCIEHCFYFNTDFLIASSAVALFFLHSPLPFRFLIDIASTQSMHVKM